MKLLFPSLLATFAFIGLPLLIAIGCKKSDDSPIPTIPVVTTSILTNITTSSATTGGTILTNGNATISQCGIVWSKINVMPTLKDSVIISAANVGKFTTDLIGLDFSTVYYVRAFASNIVGTGYGDVVVLNTTNDTSKVRFVYNGKEVTYGIIISAATGKKWLDRNLGAAQAATAFDDYKAYGDLFQWGRPADGHQLMNWASSTEGTAVYGTTLTLANSDTPGHNNYIINPFTNTSTFDWRSDNNRNRWAAFPQGPCPAGWHVPAITEWLAEISKTKGGTAVVGGIMDRSTSYSQLKLTSAGIRQVDGPGLVELLQAGNSGFYWSVTDQVNFDGYSDSKDFAIAKTGVEIGIDAKSSALCVRCLKN